MLAKMLSNAFCLGLLALSTTSTILAQSSEEVVVRQGDTIEWWAISAGPHGVKFGSDGASPINEVATLLDFLPRSDGTPAIDNNGESEQKTTGRVLTAKVKTNAQVGGKFVFVCLIHTDGRMISHPIVIAAGVPGQGRTHKIMGVTGLHWALHIDTTPPPPPNP
jgi:plastocyanin